MLESIELLFYLMFLCLLFFLVVRKASFAFSTWINSALEVLPLKCFLSTIYFHHFRLNAGNVPGIADYPKKIGSPLIRPLWRSWGKVLLLLCLSHTMSCPSSGLGTRSDFENWFRRHVSGVASYFYIVDHFTTLPIVYKSKVTWWISRLLV